MSERPSSLRHVRVPSVVAYFVILLFLAGLYRFTALGLDDRAVLAPCQSARCTEPIALRPSPGSALHFVLPTVVEGRPMLFLLDTGAASTVLSLEAARVIEEGAAARPIVGAINASYQVQQVITLQSLAIGAHVFSDFDTVAVDLSAVRAGLGLPVDGVLGANVLGALPFEIDFRAPSLRLGRDRAAFEAARADDEADTRVNMRELSGGYFVEGNADGRIAIFLVDSGSGSTQVAPALARHLPAAGRREAIQYEATGAVRADVASVHVAALVVGDFAREDVVLDVGSPNLLGADFFGGTLLRMDPAAGTLVLRYRPAAP